MKTADSSTPRHRRGGLAGAAGDNELATWTFEEWERAAGGAIRFERIQEEGFALVRLYWNGSGREHGQMKSHIGSFYRRQVILAVRPDAHARHRTLGPAAAKDPLLRDATDVMRADASAENFQRSRQRLKTRADMAKVSWLSDADAARIRALYRR